jgi:FAD dependent oxidoreductase TIGR03364
VDATTRNFGMALQTIVETGGKWSEYARASSRIYRALQAEHDLGIAVSGSLYLASTELEQRVLQEFAQQFSEVPPYECHYLTASEVGERYPFADAGYVRGGLAFAGDLALEPRRLIREIISSQVQRSTFEYRPSTLVTGVETSGEQCLVRTADGETLTTDHVFVCSGAEYHTLFPDQFMASGLQVCKLQMMRTVPQPMVLPHSLLSGLSIRRYPAFRACPSYRSLMEEPMEEDLRRYGVHLLFKQSADGTIIIGDSHEYRSLEEASSLQESTSVEINRLILEYAQRMVNLPTWELLQLWNGYYLIHPEHEIFTQDLGDSVHIVTGIGGKGMSTGPGFAEAHINAVLG